MQRETGFSFSFSTLDNTRKPGTRGRSSGQGGHSLLTSLGRLVDQQVNDDIA